jgi:hypothetical protein
MFRTVDPLSRVQIILIQKEICFAHVGIESLLGERVVEGSLYEHQVRQVVRGR